MLSLTTKQSWYEVADRYKTDDSSIKVDALMKKLCEHMEPTAMAVTDFILQLTRTKQKGSSPEALANYYQEIESIRSNDLMKDLPEKIFTAFFVSGCYWSTELAAQLKDTSKMTELYQAAKRMTKEEPAGGMINAVHQNSRGDNSRGGNRGGWRNSRGGNRSNRGLSRTGSGGNLCKVLRGPPRRTLCTTLLH